MKYRISILRLLFVFLFGITASCSSHESDSNVDDTQTKGESEFMDPNVILQGPVLRDTLSNEQMKQIDYLHATFKEVHTVSKEKWIEDFKRDQNPDQEIEIWSAMASTYNAYCSDKNLDIDTRQEVFKVVLMRSMMEPKEVLEKSNLQKISHKEAMEVMNAYDIKAKPIRIRK